MSVLLPALKYLPLACVAAILMNVAYRMVEKEELKHIFHQDKGQFLVVILVAVVSIIDEPTTAIIVGWIISMLKTCLSLSKSNTKVVVRQGSSVITSFYSDIVLTDKVMPSFMFRRKVTLQTPDAVQECFVFNAKHAPRSKPNPFERQQSEWDESFATSPLHFELGSIDTSQKLTWDDVRDLGVSEDDAAYSLVVHYMMQGQLSFITCSTHVKRIVNIQCDIVLIDLSDVSGVDLDGQVK